MSEKKDKLTQELDSKLEDLFDEDTLEDEEEPATIELSEKAPDTPCVNKTDKSPDQNKVSTNFPLDNLNAILLSLDWEITQDFIDSYLHEIENLRTEYDTDKYCDYFFRILENLGTYIKKNLGSAHPESVTMMQSMHQGLENIFLKTQISDLERKNIFYKEYNKYSKFKKKISQKQSAKAGTKKTSQVESEKFAEEFIARISDSLRKVVRDELEKVKAEIIESIKK